MLKDVFGSAEHQERASYGLGYKLTLARNKGDAVLDKPPGIADARTKVDDIHWYVPPYTLTTSQQGIIYKQILSKTPTELRYIERSVFMNKVNNQNLWNFELGGPENMNVPIWFINGFQSRNRQDSQDLNNHTFYILPITSAQCINGTEKYLDAGILLISDHDIFSQGYDQIKEAFRVLRKMRSLNRIYQIMTLDLQTSGLRILVVIHTFLIWDINKISQLTKQSM